MAEWYFTSAPDMPAGSGYWIVQARSKKAARELANRYCPDHRWSFMYRELEALHPLDRRYLGRIDRRGM
jgi:hypothetical protein